MLNNEEVTFNVCRSMNQPKDISIILVINTINEIVKVVEKLVVETLVAILISFDGDHIVDHKETVHALQGIGSYVF